MEAAPKTVEITLRSGKKLTLHEVSFLDLQDGEQLLGSPPDDWISSAPHPKFPDDPDKALTSIKNPMKTIPVMVWLMARKHGLTTDEIIARKWPFTLEQLTAELTMRDFKEHGEVLLTCFFPS